MEALKRGKSSVVETNHYLLLGWSDKSFSLIRELILAMESEGGGVIVILSERDKDEIEGEVRRGSWQCMAMAEGGVTMGGVAHGTDRGRWCVGCGLRCGGGGNRSRNNSA